MIGLINGCGSSWLTVGSLCFSLCGVRPDATADAQIWPRKHKPTGKEFRSVVKYMLVKEAYYMLYWLLVLRIKTSSS